MFPTANAVVQDLLDIKEEKDHLKRDFNNEMEYSPELTKNDYLVRSNENVASLFKDYAPSKKDDYLVIHQISTGEMHRIMKSILKVDHAAFMVSLPSNSSLAGDSSISKQEAVA